MTCIVGLEYNKKVYIGGDIQGTGPNSKIIHTQPKVFKRKSILFGYCGSYRFGQILEQNVPDPVEPKNEQDVYRWLVAVLVPNIRDTLNDQGYSGHTNCLIGIGGQLWELQSD